LRLYEMFMGPLEAVKPWQTAQVSGVVRFRDRIYSLILDNTLEKDLSTSSTSGSSGSNGSSQWVKEEGEEDVDTNSNIDREMHKTIKKVTEDIESLSFNTAISALMVHTNLLTATYKNRLAPVEYLDNLVLLVSPFAPHLAEECWQLLGHTHTLAYHDWPSYDPSLCVKESVTISIQVMEKEN
jgi:leucyl-tRNA synthetase